MTDLSISVVTIRKYKKGHASPETNSTCILKHTSIDLDSFYFQSKVDATGFKESLPNHFVYRDSRVGFAERYTLITDPRTKSQFLETVDTDWTKEATIKYMRTHLSFNSSFGEKVQEILQQIQPIFDSVCILYIQSAGVRKKHLYVIINVLINRLVEICRAATTLESKDSFGQFLPAILELLSHLSSTSFPDSLFASFFNSVCITLFGVVVGCPNNRSRLEKYPQALKILISAVGVCMSFRDNVALYAVTTVTMETSIQQDLVQHIQSLKQKVNAPPPPPDAAISTRLIKPLPRQEPIASTSKLPVEKRKKGSTSNSTLSPIVPQKRQSEEADSTRSRGFEGGTVKGKERARE